MLDRARLVSGAWRVVYTPQARKDARKLDRSGLPPRAEKLLGLLARGYRYKEIGDALDISTETVRSHLHKVYHKLHVRSRTEAVRKYFKS